MLRPQRETLRRACGWSLSAALLALTPKCLLCVLAYAGLGSALWPRRSFCGAPTDARVAPLVSLAAAGAAASLLAWSLARRRARRRPIGPQSR